MAFSKKTMMKIAARKKREKKRVVGEQPTT